MISNVNLFIGTTILLLLLIIANLFLTNQVNSLYNVKSKELRTKRQKMVKFKKVIRYSLALTIIGVLITGVMTVSEKAGNTDEVILPDLHGLGFTSDGQRLLLPAHDGIKVYANGNWSSAKGEKHDYMGFTPTDQGFYSSGHPAPGSTMKNPLGIVKSTDEGSSVQSLTLAGETDFHVMGVGYKTHVIYAFNQIPNSIMKEPGLFVSNDDGKTWAKSAMQGISDELLAVAAHPTDPSVVAASTQQGVYLSRDNGNTFEKLRNQITPISLSFSLDGLLYMSGVTTQPILLKLDTEKTVETSIQLPAMQEDAVTFMSQNPKDHNEIAIATFKKDVYLSKDGGGGWTKIVDQGKRVTVAEGK